MGTTPSVITNLKGSNYYLYDQNLFGEFFFIVEEFFKYLKNNFKETNHPLMIISLMTYVKTDPINYNKPNYSFYLDNNIPILYLFKIIKILYMIKFIDNSPKTLPKIVFINNDEFLLIDELEKLIYFLLDEKSYPNIKNIFNVTINNKLTINRIRLNLITKDGKTTTDGEYEINRNFKINDDNKNNMSILLNININNKQLLIYSLVYCYIYINELICNLEQKFTSIDLFGSDLLYYSLDDFISNIYLFPFINIIFKYFNLLLIKSELFIDSNNSDFNNFKNNLIIKDNDFYYYYLPLFTEIIQFKFMNFNFFRKDNNFIETYDNILKTLINSIVIFFTFKPKNKLLKNDLLVYNSQYKIIKINIDSFFIDRFLKNKMFLHYKTFYKKSQKEIVTDKGLGDTQIIIKNKLYLTNITKTFSLKNFTLNFFIVDKNNKLSKMIIFYSTNEVNNKDNTKYNAFVLVRSGELYQTIENFGAPELEDIYYNLIIDKNNYIYISMSSNENIEINNFIVEDVLKNIIFRYLDDNNNFINYNNYNYFN